MLKKILLALALFYSAVTFAAVDVNKASAADLDSIKGIGPSLSGKIIEERKKGDFKDWNDVTTRVKGIKAGNAAKFSAGGLTVNGTSFQGGTPAAKADKADKKTASKPAETPAAAASTPKK
jgi:competence protein ComEA